jgi:hypothetical protein
MLKIPWRRASRVPLAVDDVVDWIGGTPSTPLRGQVEEQAVRQRGERGKVLAVWPTLFRRQLAHIAWERGGDFVYLYNRGIIRKLT